MRLQLHIKMNAVFRLMRNLSIDRGLVKNVRVVVTGIGNRLVSVRLLNTNKEHQEGPHDDILIPHITFLAELPSGYTLQRRQFPLAPCYATTFNSGQGMTLDTVGVDLTRPVFSHGQLYTALLRIRNRSCAMVQLRPDENSTVNVTYYELLR
jgi:hypothetical protein